MDKRALTINSVPSVSNFIFRGANYIGGVLIGNTEAFVIRIHVDRFRTIRFTLRRHTGRGFCLSALSLAGRTVPTLEGFSHDVTQFLFDICSSSNVYIDDLHATPGHTVCHLWQVRVSLGTTQWALGEQLAATHLS